MTARIVILLASILAFLGIALGAFGAHALKDRLIESGHSSTWETAVFYHLLHSLALFALGIWIQAQAQLPFASKAAILWLLGILLFSGSLYGLSLGGPRWLGPITPLGGLSYMAGWLLIALIALKQP